jgi:hypothetical protein
MYRIIGVVILTCFMSGPLYATSPGGSFSKIREIQSKANTAAKQRAEEMAKRAKEMIQKQQARDAAAAAQKKQTAAAAAGNAGRKSAPASTTAQRPTPPSTSRPQAPPPRPVPSSVPKKGLYPNEKEIMRKEGLADLIERTELAIKTGDLKHINLEKVAKSTGLDLRLNGGSSHFLHRSNLPESMIEGIRHYHKLDPVNNAAIAAERAKIAAEAAEAAFKAGKISIDDRSKLWSSYFKEQKVLDDLIQRGGEPEKIARIKDKNGNFIPVQVPALDAYYSATAKTIRISVLDFFINQFGK